MASSSSQQAKPLTISKILLESLKLPTKNPSFILPILLLSSLSTSLIPSLSFPPLLTNLITAISSLNRENHKYASLLADTIKNPKDIIDIQVVFLLILSFVIYSLISIATIHVLSLPYSDGRTLTVSRFLRGLKGPAITSIYVILLSLGYNVMLVTCVGAVLFVAGTSTVLIALAAILAVLGLLLDLFLTMVWSVSLVVSVVEEDCYGVGAIVKAVETVRGRWRQGVSLVLIVLVMSSVISAVGKRGQAQLDIGIYFCIVAAVVMSVYERAVSIVFYFDCKKISSGEETGIVAGFVVLFL